MLLSLIISLMMTHTYIGHANGTYQFDPSITREHKSPKEHMYTYAKSQLHSLPAIRIKRDHVIIINSGCSERESHSLWADNSCHKRDNETAYR